MERAINFHLEGHPVDIEQAGPSNQIGGSSSSSGGGGRPNLSPLLPNMPTLVSFLCFPKLLFDNIF